MTFTCSTTWCRQHLQRNRVMTGEKPRFDWIQFGILLLAIIALAVSNGERLARIEQVLVDSDKDRARIEQRLETIEREWQLYQRRYNQSLMEQ